MPKGSRLVDHSKTGRKRPVFEWSAILFLAAMFFTIRKPDQTLFYC
jgi:hypothetical protein